MRVLRFLVCLGIACLPGIAKGVIVDVTVTFENLAPVNSISFAPLRVGFHNGTFDAFNNGVAATAPIISIAEGGSGSDWFPAFSAAEPNAVLGTLPDPAGPILPGVSVSRTFRVDTDVNQFFTFASMVVPSNDLFIGNDTPLRLFDPAGNQVLFQINETAARIWDAGSETADPANAAFLVGGVNAQRTPQNGVVSFAFSELSAYNGLQTAAGYTFNSNLVTAGTAIDRISFSVTAVPEPSSVLMLGLSALGLTFRRNRRKAA